MSSEVAGRNIPLWPGLSGILVELLGVLRWATERHDG